MFRIFIHSVIFLFKDGEGLFLPPVIFTFLNMSFYSNPSCSYSVASQNLILLSQLVSYSLETCEDINLGYSFFPYFLFHYIKYSTATSNLGSFDDCLIGRV